MHAVECTGVDALLAGLVEGILVAERFGSAAIDWTINTLVKEMKPEHTEGIGQAINVIERVCRGRERSELGFWS